MSLPVDLCSRPIRNLLLASNRLTWLPPALAQLTHLTHLDIANNLFTGFPSIVLKLDQLVEFSFSGNKIVRPSFFVI
jgi:internalin A